MTPTPFAICAVDGNWEFVDMSRMIGGRPLTLAIDGSGVSVFDHQIVFGTQLAETLTGEGDTDHLYGRGGDDTLEGQGGLLWAGQTVKGKTGVAANDGEGRLVA